MYLNVNFLYHKIKIFCVVYDVFPYSHLLLIKKGCESVGGIFKFYFKSAIIEKLCCRRATFA